MLYCLLFRETAQCIKQVLSIVLSPFLAYAPTQECISFGL